MNPTLINPGSKALFNGDTVVSIKSYFVEVSEDDIDVYNIIYTIITDCGDKLDGVPHDLISEFNRNKLDLI